MFFLKYSIVISFTLLNLGIIITNRHIKKANIAHPIPVIQRIIFIPLSLFSSSSNSLFVSSFFHFLYNLNLLYYDTTNKQLFQRLFDNDKSEFEMETKLVYRRGRRPRRPAANATKRDKC